MSYARTILKGLAVLLGLLAIVVLTAVVTMNIITWGKTVEVPLVEGKDLTAALVQLKDAGLEVKVDRQEHHPTVPAGSVIRQAPPSGSKVKKGRDILLVVSLGSQEVTVPDLSTDFFRRAQIRLKQVGLVLGEVLRVYSDSPREGIMVQSPMANATVQKGESVNMLVSEGPALDAYVCPNLLGMTVPQAETVVKPFTATVSTTGTGSFIITQLPLPGYRLDACGDVRVTLGAKPPPAGTIPALPGVKALPAQPAKPAAPTTAAATDAKPPVQPVTTPTPPVEQAKKPAQVATPQPDKPAEPPHKDRLVAKPNDKPAPAKDIKPKTGIIREPLNLPAN